MATSSWDSRDSTPWWALTLALVASIWLILTFKVAGAFLALGVLGLTVIASRRPDAIEVQAIVASIRLSSEDISAVLDEFDAFRTGPGPDDMEDRLFRRPALLDPDSAVPEIAAFYDDMANAQRFLHRLPARLAGKLTVRQADRLLAITDDRARHLQQSWHSARRAAWEIGSA